MTGSSTRSFGSCESGNFLREVPSILLTPVYNLTCSGYGSYAIVYLVKEVLYDHSEDELPNGDDESTISKSQQVVYGREFALKCLSKRNLSEDQITVQKFEATLHRQLPEHENVVALHKVSQQSLLSSATLWLY